MTAALLNPPLITIRLHGHLATRFGRVHQLAVETAAEAVRALDVVCKGFAEAVRGWDGPGYRVRAGEGDRAHWLDEHTMRMTLGQARRLDIVPSISGRKKNGTGQVIAGIVLVVIGYFTASYDGGATMQAGFGLILGGAIALLAPVPKGSDSKAKEEVSKQLNGPPNITSAGGPVPLIIGRVLIGSVTISAGLSTDQVPIAVADPGPADLPFEEPLTYDWGGDTGDSDGDAGDGGVGG